MHLRHSAIFTLLSLQSWKNETLAKQINKRIYKISIFKVQWIICELHSKHCTRMVRGGFYRSWIFASRLKNGSWIEEAYSKREEPPDIRRLSAKVLSSVLDTQGKLMKCCDWSGFSGIGNGLGWDMLHRRAGSWWYLWTTIDMYEFYLGWDKNPLWGISQRRYIFVSNGWPSSVGSRVE